MPIDPNVHPEWAAETKLIAQSLDQLDYYQVLGAEHDTPPAELKTAYHELQRNYHPDAFYASPDAELKRAVHLIAKRVAEAYVILRDPNKRAKYTKDILGPNREKKLRYTDQSELEARREKEEAFGKTPQVRQLWTKALEAERQGNLSAAERDLKTALIFESDNEHFIEKLKAIRAQKESP